MPDDVHQPALSQLLRRIHVGSSIPVASTEEPSDDELIRLIEGSLSEEQRRSLEERLKACPYSADRVAIVREALREAGVIVPGVWYLSDD